MIDFVRYLAAKQTVDDRALNAHVYETLRAALPPGPLDVLEVGAGAGAMLDRLATRGLGVQRRRRAGLHPARRSYRL